MRLSAVAIAFVAVAATKTSVVCGYPCNGTVPAPPSVRTLVASPKSPELEAWVVESDCSVSVMKAGSVNKGLYIDGDTIRGVQSIVSVPTEVEAISLSGLGRLPVANFTNAKHLKSLSCHNSTLPTIDSTTLPGSLISLTLVGNGISTLQGVTLPPALEELNLGRNDIATIDAELPKALKTLVLSSNPITALDKAKLPSMLQTLILRGTSVTVVRGTKFPRSLTYLQIGPLDITTFEIREQDFALLSQLSTLSLRTSQAACSESSAQIKTLGSNNFCVISDAKFAELYGGQVDDVQQPSGTVAASTSSSSSSTSPVTVVVASVVAVLILAGGFVAYRVYVVPTPRVDRSSEVQDNGDQKFLALSGDVKDYGHQ